MPYIQKINNSKQYRQGSRSVFISPKKYNAVVSGTYYSLSYNQGIKLSTEHNWNTEYEYNLAITAASEGVINIPDGATQYEFQVREASVDVRWALVSGKAFYSQNPYFTLKAGTSYANEYFGDGLYGEKLYFAANTNATIEFRSRVGPKQV